jgi:hypothetical protein
MALGLTLGVVFAVSGNNTTTIAQSANGVAAGPSGSASPSASPSVATNAVVPPAPSFAGGPTAFRQFGDLATVPVDGTGAAINLNQTAAQAAASMNCTLTVPASPLTAQGLATPYQLGDGCSEANVGTEGAFVEATILSPGGTLQVYNPLVITAGTTPAAPPVVPTIAPGSAVIIDIGFNGTNLVLQGPGARQGRCVDALGQSVIGQVSACNAVNFYRMANAEIANGTLTVPPAGASQDGQACLTTRDFGIVDQDQSDNVITSYLVNGNGQTAQNTAANAAAIAGSQAIVNGSDDKLLAAFVDPATGCTPFTAPDSTDPAGTSGSQALNELSARVSQRGVIALVPPNDEMTLVNGAFSIAKTNVYRSLVDQPLLAPGTDATQVAAAYCQNMTNIAPARDKLDMARELNVGSPVAAVGSNLATFLGNRLSMSFTNLGCGKFGLTNPAAVTLDGNQVATAVTYNTAQQQAMLQASASSGTPSGTAPADPTATPTATAPAGGGTRGWRGGHRWRHHRWGRRYQDPSGM